MNRCACHQGFSGAHQFCRLGEDERKEEEEEAKEGEEEGGGEGGGEGEEEDSKHQTFPLGSSDEVGTT